MINKIIIIIIIIIINIINGNNNNDNIEYNPEINYKEYFEFIETFQYKDHFIRKESSWIKSSNNKYSEQEWAHGTIQNDIPPGIDGDKSIVVGIPHKHYGISKLIPIKSINNQGKDLVIQYEVRLHQGIGCSGAYLKLISEPENGLKFNPLDLNENTGYTIMFGPDRCGTTNKVHLIFRIKNPISGKWEEKHMTQNVPAETDTLTHLYTVELKSDGKFRVLVDLIEKASGSLSDPKAFKPPFPEPKEIDDPNDVKPSDWVDKEKIPDPLATKPDDWDEDAPKMIKDPNAFKPSGWEDNEPLDIPDPNASEPNDWVEEDDGKWEPPMIPNPKCSIGCGTWQHPLISNPSYKGKWSPPLIANPAYIGPWAPKKIQNPYYFENKNIADLPPIAAVAIEILANERGIGFDNILIGYDIEAANKFAKETFTIKNIAEKSLETKLKKEKSLKERLEFYNEGGFGVIRYFSLEIVEFISDNPIPIAIGFIVIIISTIYFCCWNTSSNLMDEDIKIRKEALKQSRVTEGKKVETIKEEVVDDDEDELDNKNNDDDIDDIDDDEGEGAISKSDSSKKKVQHAD